MNEKSIIKSFIIFYLVIFFLPFFLEIFIPTEESTGPNDYARIVEMDYKGIVMDEPNKGGKLLVTETITFDIHAASEDNPFWELWRDLSEDYVDGLKIDYDVLSVKQIHADGSKTTWKESNKLYWDDSDYTDEPYGPGKWYHSPGPYDEYSRDYEAIFFYIEPTYRGKMTFEIQYIMNNASLRYSDVSELYISMFSGNDTKYLESFSAELLVPLKDMPDTNNYTFHTFGTNSNTFYYTESDTKNPGYHTFTMNLNKENLKFRPYNQYLEFTLLSHGNDVHKFTDYAPKNLYSDDVYLEEALAEINKYDELPSKFKIYKTILFIICLFSGILIIKKILTRDKKIKTKHKLYEPIQSMQYFRDIPSDLDPYFAATLVFAKDKKKKVDIGDAYSAIMLSLVRKGYIELERINPTKNWTKSNIMIKILYKPTTNILNNEQIAATNNTFINLENNSQIENIINNNDMNLSTSNETPLKIIRINKKGKELEELTSNEQTYFNLITRHAADGEITMSKFQNKITNDYNYTNSFVTAIDSSIVEIGIYLGYFQKANYNQLNKTTRALANAYLIIGLLILILGNFMIYQTRLDLIFGGLILLGLILVIGSFYLRKFTNKYTLLTQYGEDEYAKWRALYDFLNSETLMNEKTVIDIVLWEKYLVYATAFGISDKVIKALEIHCPEVSENESAILGNRYYRSSSYRSSSRSFRTATHSASSASRNGGYGSYGGGGRGGGGGGGGH